MIAFKVSKSLEESEESAQPRGQTLGGDNLIFYYLAINFKSHYSSLQHDTGILAQKL